MKKLFVLDTNVILYDPNCIFNFDEHDISIPIVVLEELDNFKKGNDVINKNARMFARTLDKLSASSKTPHVMSLGKGKGKLSIDVKPYEFDYIAGHIDISKNDNKILGYVNALMLEKEKRDVILVTKDINLRMKARAFHAEAQDYETGKVQDIDALYTGYREIEVEPELIDALFKSEDGLTVDTVEDVVANEYYIFKAGKQSALAKYSAATNSIVLIREQSVAGIYAKNVEQKFAIDAILDPNIPLVSISGKAGTGKTLLALASAIGSKKDYHQIYLARPIVPMGKDIGYLPGDINEKLDPYMQPLWDNLEVVKKAYGKADAIQKLVNEKKIVVSALPFIRGRSLPKICFIVDEAQNLTPHEIKTIITRIGEDSKLIFTGDIYQIDTPYLDAGSNGLSYLIDKMRGQKLYAHINLVKGERSELAELASNIL